MDDEVGRLRQCVDLFDGCLESGADIRVGGLVEAHMAVADLDEAQFARRRHRMLAEGLRRQHAAADGPDHACSGPGHALQEAAAINTVVVTIVNDFLGQFSPRECD
jgi:hypothetical protein